MNWYLVKMIYRVTSGEGSHTAQFDEQLKLFQASCQEEAIDKAGLAGVKMEETFFNIKGELVRWQFVAVAEIRLLEEFEDGMEICSRIVETGDPDNYLRFVHSKAENIHSGNDLNLTWQ